MRAGGELRCPAGTVLQPTGGIVHSDEPDYCIEIMEVDQQSTELFLAEREKSGFELRSIPQPEGNLKGPKKPTIFFEIEEARAYCRWKYPGGDLPTNKQ